MLPSEFRPLCVEDFIGPARVHASFITELVAAALPTRAPLCLLITGGPGDGKTSLANFFAKLLGANKWTIHQYNGASLGIEEMEAMSRSSQLTEMFGNYRVFNWEEGDKMSTAAQVCSLTMLDNLTKGNAVVVTTNKPRASFEPRFQRRFKPIELGSPSAEEIAAFLTARFNIPARHALQTAREAIIGCGGVGQALQDADSLLVALKMQADRQALAA